jgi:MFS family permease
LEVTWGHGEVVWRLFVAGCGNGLFNAPNMATAMTNAPHQLLATTGASTSLARQLGFALGPVLATLMWSLSAYQPSGMRAAILLATALSAASVIALARTRTPGAGAAQAAATVNEPTETERR